MSEQYIAPPGVDTDDGRMSIQNHNFIIQEMRYKMNEDLRRAENKIDSLEITITYLKDRLQKALK